VGGVDNLRGCAFQIVQALSDVVDLVVDERAEAVVIEGEEHFVDYATLDRNGRRLAVRQAKTRQRSGTWGAADLARILRGWGELADAEEARFAFVTDGRLGRSGQELYDLIRSVKREPDAAALSAGAARLGLGAGDLPPLGVLRRVEIWSQMGATDHVLVQLERRIHALLERTRPTTTDEAQSAANKLFVKLFVAGGRVDLARRTITRSEVLATLGVDERSRPGGWFMPVPEGRDVVARPNLLDDVVHALLAAPGSGASIGLEGAGGFGKTTLAALACRDSRVLAHFPDGVLWKTVGQRAVGADLTTAVNDLAEYLTGQRPTYADANLAGSHLARVIGDRRCLLVLDDVWKAEQLTPFLAGAPNCVRLVTTRVGAALPRDAVSVRVTALTTEQAHAVLGRGLRVTGAGLAGLAVRTGRWAVLCGLVNGALRRRVAHGGTVAEAIAWARDMLDTGGPTGLDAIDPAGRELAVGATIAASLDMMATTDPGGVARYRELGVFPTDTAVPLDTLARFWQRTGGLDRHEAERLCYAFAEANLIEEFRLDPPAIRLHDVVAGYLRHEALPRATELNGALLDSYRQDLPGGDDLPTAWWRLPAGESYLWRHLATHLRDAGRVAELVAVLRDLRWACVKVHRLGPAGVRADTAVVSDDRHARALDRIVRGTGHLHQPGDPMAMSVAALAGYAAGDPVLAPAAEVLFRRMTTPYLRPTAPPLPDQPHPAVSHIFRGHEVGASVLAGPPDGAWLASGGYCDPIRVWDPVGGTEMFSLTADRMGVRALVAAPDGSWLASDGDRTVRLWNMPAGTERAVLTGHATSVWSLAAAPDGSWLASGDDGGTVRVWNTADGAERAVLSGFNGRVSALAVAPDGTWLAIAGCGPGDGVATLWRPSSGARLNLRAAGSHGAVTAFAVAPDGSWLAGAVHDTVRVWNPDDGRQLRSLTGHTAPVRALAVAPDGSWLASGGEDGVVRLWGPDDRVQRRALAGHTGRINALAVAPDGSWLASATGDFGRNDDSTVRVWDLAGGTSTVLTGHSEAVHSLMPAPDGSWLASGGRDHTVRIWNVAAGRPVKADAHHTGEVVALEMAPDGSWLASTGRDGVVRLWNPADATQRAVLARHTGLVVSLVMAPDGSWLASLGEDCVRLWNMPDGTERTVLNHSGRVCAAVAAPDGSWLAIAGRDDITVWNVETGRLNVTVPADTARMVAAGSWLACADDAGTVRLHDPVDGTCLARLATRSVRVTTLAAAPDGSWFACSGYGCTIGIWNPLDGTAQSVLAGHTGEALVLAVAPDGSWLASAGHDHTVRVWNAADGTQRAVIQHAAIVSDVAIAPNGAWLASAGQDGSVLLSDPSDGRILAATRVDGRLRHCVVNPTRPQVVVAGSGHIYFLNVVR
jgi:WD40 repeat protein